MASAKDLKKRILTVKNTQQTTRALKMISAVKLRKAQQSIHENRPYVRVMKRMVQLASDQVPIEKLPSFVYRQEQSGFSQKKAPPLLVLFTSDRGLCGSFNHRLIRFAQNWAQTYSEVKWAFMGRKGKEILTRKGMTALFYREFGSKSDYAKARELTQWILSAYEKGAFGKVYFIYNEFKSAMSQRVVAERYVPVLEKTLFQELAPPSSEEAAPEALAAQPSTDPSLEDFSQAALYRIKPSAQSVLRRLLEKYFVLQTYRVCLESEASEHGARMTSMENATRNAGDMIRKLTLAYNKQRQAGITKELLEIISGTEAQKQG